MRTTFYSYANFRWILFSFIFYSFYDLLHGRNYEIELYEDLLKDYEILERPVKHYSDAVDVELKISLMQLVDVDEKNQILTVNIWLILAWIDYNFQWDPALYGNVLNISMPANKVWKPDVLLYNSVDNKFDTKYMSNVVLYPTGDVSWIPPGIVKISCNIKIKWFPFDEQDCYFKYGSWTYTKQRLNLRFPDNIANLFDTSEYMANGEWIIKAFWNDTKRVPDGDEMFEALFYYFTIRRQVLYYAFNMILPSIFYSLITLLGFVLPVECNEKITLEITIMVNICFFLQMVLNVTPTTSQSVPLIGVFFSFHIFIVSLSVVFQVLVINLYFRTPATHPEMSPKVRYILLHWLPWLLALERPGEKFNKTSLREAKQEMKENLAKLKAKSRLKYSSLEKSNKTKLRIENSNNNNDDDEDIDERINKCLQKLVDDPTFDDPCFEALLTFVHKVHKELKFITERMKRLDKAEDEKNDWKFASAVIDRLCLYLFTFLIITGTGVILLSAPQLVAGPALI